MDSLFLLAWEDSMQICAALSVLSTQTLSSVADYQQQTTSASTRDAAFKLHSG